MTRSRSAARGPGEGAYGLPVDSDGPVFHAPWQAQAFAMVVHLQEQGLFSASEWVEQLGHCITEAQAKGDADLGDTYYDHWLTAFEELLVAKGLVSQQSLEGHRLAIKHEQSHPHSHDHD
jgi:nitrile hydratase accessory protein